MNDSRFSVSMHILTLLARSGGELLSSDEMAESININPVLVRKELINLRQHKLVASKEGKNGGTCLMKQPAEIFLSDVYLAVHSSTLFGLSKNKPNPSCPIGRQMTKHLNSLYADAETSLLKELKKITLKKFVKQFG